MSFPIYTWQEKGYTKEIEVDEDPSESKKDETDDNVAVRILFIYLFVNK